jgi:hypothetical protein
VEKTGVRWASYWLLGAMLLGCDTEAARKLLTSKGVAVPSDSFEAEFPNRGRDAGGTSVPTEEGTRATSGGDHTRASSESASASSETSVGSASTVDVVSSADVVSSLGVVDATSGQSQLGPAVLLQLLSLDLPCGEKQPDADNYVCKNTDCVDGIDVTDSWALPGDATGSYDLEIELTGIVETFGLWSGEPVATNELMTVVFTTEPAPGNLNAYEIRVGDANYLLNATPNPDDLGGAMYTLDGISFTLSAVPGGTPVSLRAVSNDCYQISTCWTSASCTNEVVPDDKQHVQVTLTATSR